MFNALGSHQTEHVSSVVCFFGGLINIEIKTLWIVNLSSLITSSFRQQKGKKTYFRAMFNPKKKKKRGREREPIEKPHTGCELPAPGASEESKF